MRLEGLALIAIVSGRPITYPKVCAAVNTCLQCVYFVYGISFMPQDKTTDFECNFPYKL